MSEVKSTRRESRRRYFPSVDEFSVELLRQVQQAQTGTVPREVHEGVERTAARGLRSAFPGSSVATRRDAYVERLDGGESLRDRTQVGGSALEVEVARQLERKVAKRGEGEQGAHDVQEGSLEGVFDRRDEVNDATVSGRNAAVRLGYEQTCD